MVWMMVLPVEPSWECQRVTDVYSCQHQGPAVIEGRHVLVLNIQVDITVTTKIGIEHVGILTFLTSK